MKVTNSGPASLPWSHAGFQSAGPNPTQISLDYKRETDEPSDTEQYTYAKPLWMNVERPGLGPDDKVRAVWMPGVSPAQQVDLTYAGGDRFTAQLPDTYISGADESGGEYFPQQLAMVVDGDWLKDPSSGQSNFNVSL